MSTADEPDLVGADATDVETPPPLAVVPRPQPRTPAVRRPRTPAPVPRMEHDVANVADGGSSPPGGTTRAAGDGARRTCTAPAGAGLGLQNPRRRVRFPGGVRRHVGDEHMPPSRGWDTTLRTSLARVRVLPVARHARHAASSGEGERLISARGGLDSLRCDSRGAHLYLLARRRAAHGWLLVLLVRFQSPRPAQVTTRGCSSTVEQNIV